MWLTWIFMTIFVKWNERKIARWLLSERQIYTEQASYIYCFKTWSCYVYVVNPPYTCFTNKCCTEASTITTMAIPYAFPSKPSNKLFPCIYLAAYSHLPGCCLHNSLIPKTSVLLLQLVRYCLSSHSSCVPQKLRMANSVDVVLNLHFVHLCFPQFIQL